MPVNSSATNQSARTTGTYNKGFRQCRMAPMINTPNPSVPTMAGIQPIRWFTHSANVQLLAAATHFCPVSSNANHPSRATASATKIALVHPYPGAQSP